MLFLTCVPRSDVFHLAVIFVCGRLTSLIFFLSLSLLLASSSFQDHFVWCHGSDCFFSYFFLHLVSFNARSFFGFDLVRYYPSLPQVNLFACVVCRELVLISDYFDLLSFLLRKAHLINFLIDSSSSPIWRTFSKS